MYTLCIWMHEHRSNNTDTMNLPLTALPFLLFLFGSCNTLKTCQKNSANFEECLETALNKYMPELDDEYVVESTRKGKSSNIDKGPLKVLLEYKNASIIGTNKGKITLKYNPVTSTISGTIHIPKSIYILPFLTEGTFGEIEFGGVGVGRCVMEDYVSSYIYEVKRYEDNGKISLKMSPLYYSIDSIKKVTITYDKISSPTKKKEEALKLISEQFADLLIQLVKPEYEKLFKEHFAQIAVTLLERVMEDGVYKPT